MVDLHLHLDGSLSVEDFLYLSKKDGVELGKDFPSNIYVPNDCPSLEEYLTRFDLPLLLLQSKENIEYAFHSLVTRLAKLNYLYAEIRFAPLLHKQKGLSQKEVVESALKGVNKALEENKNIIVNIILCCMRHASEEDNMETIETANLFKGTRVVAVDLAGAEALHPSSYYKRIFDKAKEYKLNITIHAGEATGSDEILMAIANGATRIGHGVHLSLDDETIKIIKENDICFEFCPTSNLQTKSLKTYEDVPLMDFINNGINVTLNSDNMTVSNTTAIEEARIMIETFGIDKETMKKLCKTSIIYSFSSNNDKKWLLEKFDDRFEKYWQELNK